MTKTKQPVITYENKKEIAYHLINSAIVFGISLCTAVIATSFVWTWTGFGAALAAGLLTAFIKFKNYWDEEKPEYTKKILTFI